MTTREEAVLNSASANSYPTSPPVARTGCKLEKTLTLGIFFDGSGKNLYRDRSTRSPTNVARLYNVYKEYSTEVSIQSKLYVVGIGGGNAESPKPSDGTSMVDLYFGMGGKKRLNIAYNWVKEKIKQVSTSDDKILDIFGFSRGASLARTFSNLIVQGLVQGKAGEEVVPNLRVRFVGIFDTVGSIGLSSDNRIPGQALSIENLGIEKISHFTARHEMRRTFPLTLCGDADREYPGTHSDVGGGFPPENENGTVNHLAFITFKDMWLQARQVDVDLSDWRSQVDLSDDEIEALRREADIYAPRGQVYNPTPTEPRTQQGTTKKIERSLDEPVPEQVLNVCYWPTDDPNGKTESTDENVFDTYCNWWQKYIHKSHSSAFGMEMDPSGMRRRFIPKRFELVTKPPNFKWSERP